MKKELLMTSVQAVFCAKEQWAPRQVYGPGARPHFLLYTVLDGKGILQYKNNIYQLQAGDTFYFSPGDMIYLEADEYTPWQIAWTAFTGDEAGNHLAASCFAGTPVRAVPEDPERLFSYAQHLVDVFEKECSNLAEINGSLTQLLSLLLPRPKARSAAARECYLARAKEYIENNYCYDIKIQDIAHQIGIDRSYIYRLFIDLEHMAPKDFLMASRLKHACEMLAEGCSVVETAYSCGFVDPESFQYHFRNTYHSSPEEYLWERERHEGQPLRR